MVYYFTQRTKSDNIFFKKRSATKQKLKRYHFFSTYKRPALALLLAASAQSLSAAPIFSEDFEGLTVGQVEGQGGWTGSTLPEVSTNMVYAGSQAAELDSTGAPNFSGASQAITTTASVISTKIQFKMDASGPSVIWQPISLSGDNGFLGQITVFGGSGQIILGLESSGVYGGNLSFGQWHEIEHVTNFTSGNMYGFLDGALFGSGPIANANTTLSKVGFGLLIGDGTTTAFFDDLVVTAVPEPTSSSLLLLGTAVAGLTRRSRS